MRKLAWFALPFSAATFLAQLLLPRESWLALGAVCAVLFLAVILFRLDLRLRLTAAGLALAFLWSWGYHALFQLPAEHLAGTEGEYTAVVLDWPEEMDYGVRVLVGMQVQGREFKTRLYLYDRTGLDFCPGDQITGPASFSSAALYRGEEVTWNLSKGIQLVAYSGEEWTVTGWEFCPEVVYANLARDMTESVERFLPEEEAGFVTALLLGDRGGISAALSSSLSRAGLSHVVAVSGLHLAFLAGLLTLPGKGRRKTALWCIPVLILFAGAAGFTPSVVRAAVMECFLLLAPVLGRENDPPTSLSAALFFLLAVNPSSAGSISLQLSFAAVAGIFLLSGKLYDFFRDKLGERGKGPACRWVLSSLSVSLGSSAFTLPLVAWHFGMVSLVSPISNLLVLWAVSLLFPLAMVMALVGVACPPLGELLAVPVRALTVYVTGVADYLGNLPLAAVTTRGFLVRAWVVLLMVTVVLMYFSAALRRRWYLPMGGLIVAFCLAVGLTRLELNAGSFQVTALDVGQGQCVCASSGGVRVAIDCGGSSLDDPGDLLADYILDCGGDKLDLLVLTHFHTDHVSGVPELLRRISVERLALPDVDEESVLRAEIVAAAEEQGTELWWITDDETVELGGMTLRIYAPLGAGEKNEEGLSVLCSVEENDLLITGDMTTDIEKRLVKYGDLPKVEVLVAGHHGSKYASGAELLQTVRPEVALISVGYNNYGHPAEEALDRLAAVGAEIYRTDLQGELRVQFR